MSWKSLVTASLLCVLASPAFAAPTLALISGGSAASGNLDASGNWVWTAQVTPDLALAPSGTSMGLELGFTSSSTGAVAGQGGLINVTNASPSVFDTNNPGNQIFNWETTYGSPLKPEGIEANCTGCTVTNAAANGGHASTVVAGTANQIYASLGSADITTAGAKNLLTITAKRPAVSLANPNTSDKIAISGSYSGNGRIAQLSGANTANFDTFTGSFTRNARGGDSDLNGQVNFADFQGAIALNYGQSGKTWQQGDFDGNGTVDFTDFQILATQYNTSYTVGPTSPGAGAGLGSAAVPEPASIALLGLAMLGGMGLLGRKR
jgi:hypothetical protein